MSWAIHRRTLGSIMLQGVDAERSTDRALVYVCGCAMHRSTRRRGARWDLCSYHEGYDDAASEAAEPIVPASGPDA